MRLKVDNLQAITGCDEPRWSGEVMFPEHVRATQLLLIFFKNRWHASELYCPHEKASLADAELNHNDQLQCPRHHNCYSLNSCAGHILDVKQEDNGFVIDIFPQAELAERYLALDNEIEALRTANNLRENQIIDNLAQMDSMLREVEQSKSALQDNYQQSESMAMLFKRLMNSISEILLVLDKQGKISRCNRLAEAVFQIDKRQIIGINPDSLLAKDSLQQLAAQITPQVHGSDSLIYEAIRQNSPFEMEVSFSDEEKNSNQTSYCYLLHGSILYNRSGMDEGCVVLAKDISQVKQREKAKREEQLIEKAKLLQVTMDNVSNGMAVFNAQGQLQVWNNAFFHILQYPQHFQQKDVLFQELQSFDRRREESPYGDSAIPLMAIPTSNRFEYQFSNGCSIELMVNELPDNGRVISVLDVTEQKNVEATIRQINESLEKRVNERTMEIRQAYQALEGSLQQLQNTQDQLIQSEKMASLGQLVAGIAHEMNTPVGVCLTTISFLAENTRDIRKLYTDNALTARNFNEYLENAQSSLDFGIRNLQRAAKLVSSFKQLAMEQRNEPRQDINLYSHIKEIITTLDPHFLESKPQISLIGSRQMKIFSYPSVWAQIVSSLVLNSLRHAFAKMPQGEGRISIDFSHKNETLLMSFIDNGCGMDKQQCENIFEPFYTTSRGRGDIGLGMHIVFNMVNQVLKGTISCHSDPGEGTRFMIRMPL